MGPFGEKKGFDSQLRLVVVFSFLFLGLLWIHATNLEADKRRAIAEAAKARLALAAQSLVLEIHATRPALDDPFVLYTLAERHGLSRMVLIDDGRVIGDSSGKVKREDPASAVDLPQELLRTVGPEQAFYYGPVPGPARRPSMMYVFRPGEDREDDGRILALEAPLQAATDEGAAEASGPLLKVFGFTGVMVFVYFLLRSLIVDRGKAGAEGEPTGMVIDSFHDLIGRLKAKEQELEALRKRAEDRAEAIESYNEDVLRSVSSGVITFDLKREVTTFNNAAERILGIPVKQAVGSSCEAVFGPDNRISALLESSLENQAEMSRQEFELRRRDGASIWVGVSTSILRDRQDRPRGATVVFTDLTEIKRLQEQVELRRRLTVLGEMSAGIAHEFRNYMGTVMGFAKLLSRKMDREDPRQEMAAAIIRELDAMDRLIKDLLGFGRQEEVTLKPTELEPLIRRLVLQTLAQVGAEPRPNVALHFETGLTKAALDEVLFPQAFSNLVQNAVEAMRGGGELTVRASVRERADAVPAGRQAAHEKEIEISVSDTGAGIARDNLERIFLPFFTTKEKGTGLGLALAHKIILSHGGRIAVESREGSGTTFHVFLPAVVPDAETAAVPFGSRRK